jgi:hypothetical protein
MWAFGEKINFLLAPRIGPLFLSRPDRNRIVIQTEDERKLNSINNFQHKPSVTDFMTPVECLETKKKQTKIKLRGL